ncbi:MAG: hypothetical protein JWP00_2180 [Chloroflexi bacterium]|jgi:methyl-accepting chemotaxis protein|nr:hypothetical protein [Chloroflexota bacterium]
MFKSLVSSLQHLRWPLRNKLGLAFGVVLVSFVFNGMVSLYLLTLIRQSEDQRILANLYLERNQRYDLIYNSGQLVTYSDAVFTNNSRIIRDNFAALINTELQKRNKNVPFLGSTTFDSKFEQAYLVALVHFVEISELARTNQIKVATERWPTYDADFKRVTDLLLSQMSQLEKERSGAETTVVNASNLATITICTLTVLSIALALFMLLILQHVIVRPLNRLQEGLNELGRGRFDHTAVQVVNRDEVGNLAASFQAAVVNIEKVFQGVQITGTLRNVTEKLAIISKQQQSGSAEQIAAMTQVMASMQELGQTAVQIANSTADVAGLSNQTLVHIERVAQSGIHSQERTMEVSAVVNLTVNRIEEIGQQVDEFGRAMTHLNTQAITINKVVELLRTIAEEVHLLALNAAIEAASAGEYGERFRVVAREIKDLANRSNKSTQEAQELVSEVQQSSQSTSALVEQGRVLIATIYEANSQLNYSLNGLEMSSQEVAEAARALLSMANQVNARAEEIKQATQQQQIASEQVLGAIRSASEVAEQTANSTNLIVDSSNQLDNLTYQLGGVLSQVQVVKTTS